MLWPRTTLALALTFGPLALAGRAEDAAPRPTARLFAFDEIQTRLGDPKLRVLDVRPRTVHDKGHVPGAVWVDVKTATQTAAKPGGLTDRSAWETWLAALAVPEGADVVVMDGDRQLDAARVWWLLGYLGVGRVGLADGNLALWKSQGRPLTTEPTRVEPVKRAVAFDASRHATRDQMLDALRKGGDAIVDARSAAEYDGTNAVSKRGGHVPGACHLEWTDLVGKDGCFPDPAALRARLGALGVKPGAPVITHCQGGGRASVNAFVLERLGHPARNYYLGWSDWGNVDDTPVVTGKDRGDAKKP